MSDIQDVFVRALAIAKEALPELSGAPYFFHSQSDFPYMVFRLGSTDYASNSEDIEDTDMVVIMRLVVAHLTEGYSGENEDTFYSYRATIRRAFARQYFLTSEEYPTPLDAISPRGCFLLSDTGLRVFNTLGITAQQIGTEFTLSVPFYDNV